MFKKYRPALDLFLEFMGDRPVDQIRQMDIENYFDLLCKLPPRWFDEKRIRKASGAITTTTLTRKRGDQTHC